MTNASTSCTVRPTVPPTGRGIGIAVAVALHPQGITTLDIPGGQLALIAALATAVGIVAAFHPARRAARVDIIQVVTTE